MADCRKPRRKSHGHLGKSLPERENLRCRGPEAGACLENIRGSARSRVGLRRGQDIREVARAGHPGRRALVRMWASSE